MQTPEIKKAHQTQLCLAFAAGRQAAERYVSENRALESWTAMFRVGNPYAENGGMPERACTVRGAMWHAYEAGIYRALGRIADAATGIRNARFVLRRAAELGRA
jgi:hypothetical protein